MKLNSEFVLRQIDGVNIVVALGEKAQSNIITLNDTGAFLWRGIERGLDLSALAKALTENYEVDEKVAQADVKAFVERMKEAGILSE